MPRTSAVSAGSAFSAFLREISQVFTGRIADLPLSHRSEALAVLIAFVVAAALALIARAAFRRGLGRDQIVVPALFRDRRPGFGAIITAVPLLVAVAGTLALLVALADPYMTIAEREADVQGRRIALLIDASSSMLKPFEAGRLNAKAATQSAFFTSVGAAEAFIRQRRDGNHRDLIALLEFGDEAYVITPFTTDYDNVLLSASLIGDWTEFMHFPNQGTTIAAALEQGINLFKMFDFVKASGNLMVIFSDGEDTQATLHGRPISDILSTARAASIPVFFVRTNRDKALGSIVPDALWKSAVESTGGAFYAAAREKDIERAIEDIDRRAPGVIRVKQYTANQPYFGPFAAAAAALWTIAVLLRLGVPQFSRFP
jgi:hypothetical protein